MSALCESAADGRHANACRRQVACFESHRKAWARIVEEDWRQAVVMEDDAEVDLSEHMPKVAQFVADAPPDWQLLYLGINNARVRALLRQSSSIKRSPRWSWKSMNRAVAIINP